MKIGVRLFAGMRLRAGVSRVDMEVPDGVTLAAALEALYRRYPDLRGLGANCLVAVGLEYVPHGRVLRDGEEISLIPPVAGG